MRWLLLKDLQILRRSPFLVGLLVVYPVAVALLIGFALSRGPDSPRIAIYNAIPPDERTFDIGGEPVNAREYLPELARSVEAVPAASREEALRMVRDGEVLAAVILPPDVVDKLVTGRRQPTIEVVYNGEDPVKQRFVESVIKARLADANAALARRFEQITVGYIELLLRGGSIEVLGRDVQILGLRAARAIVAGARAALPPDSELRAPLAQVDRFATLAIDNLGIANDVLRSLGQPIRVEQTVIGGSRTPLDAFAVAVSVSVSLMFLALLLASGLLALEREEHAFPRLVRGLVSRLGLLVEKVALAALCALVVALAMLLGLGAFFVELDWARLPLWIVVLAASAGAFAALGVAVGGIAREVRAASLLAFLLSLPIAFLALVPSGSIAPALYDVTRVVSAAFPFRATLDALDAALGGGAGLVAPLLHLVALAVAWTAIARLALRRFA
jgi:hypothetical protein